MSENENIVLYDTAEQAKVSQEVKTFDLVDPSWPVVNRPTDEFDFDKPPVDPNEFASTLVETAKKINALGLSANQTGNPFRVFVLGSGDEYVAYFNPKVISTEGEVHMSENCPSFPLLQLKITRPKKIDVEYQDWTGAKHNKTFDGMTARLFLHELDHLDGILYTTRVKPLALKSGMKKVEKMYNKFFKQIRNGNKKANSRNR